MLHEEMTEDHHAQAAKNYYRVSSSGTHAEQIVAARVYILALQATICMLNQQGQTKDAALLAF